MDAGAAMKLFQQALAEESEGRLASARDLALQALQGFGTDRTGMAAALVVSFATEVSTGVAGQGMRLHRGAVVALVLVQPLRITPTWAAIITTDAKRV